MGTSICCGPPRGSRLEAWLSEGFHAGANDALNARALAEARTIEAGLPSRRHIDAPRWPGVGTLARWAGLAILAIIVAGWLLTLLNGG